MKKSPLLRYLMLGGALTLLSLGMCGAKMEKDAKSKDGAITEITSAEQFQSIVDGAGQQLLAFDLYADWCSPCRILMPRLEKIAAAHKSRVSFYRINVDKLPQLAQAFRVSGIPLVAFVKNKTVVAGLQGLQPESEYVKAINEHAGEPEPASQGDASGVLQNGLRTIRFEAGYLPQDLYVHRGEQVRLLIGKSAYAYSLAIPGFNVTADIDASKEREIRFSADSVGVFRMFCNGNCPVGRGKQEGRIIVMETAAAEPLFKNIGSAEFKKLMAGQGPLVLDVRTPQEFFAGHLPGARLIPIDQLGERLSEIAEYKNRDVLVYCRSGNRSLTGSQILRRGGFNKVYNLKGGIIDWRRKGFEVNTPQSPNAL